MCEVCDTVMPRGEFMISGKSETHTHTHTHTQTHTHTHTHPPAPSRSFVFLSTADTLRLPSASPLQSCWVLWECEGRSAPFAPPHPPLHPSIPPPLHPSAPLLSWAKRTGQY